MKRHHEIENIRFEGGNLLITIDGREKSFPLDQVSSILENASDNERVSFEISCLKPWM